MSMRERRVALRNSGLIDPKDIRSYIEHGHGYLALTRALKSGPEAVLTALEGGGLETLDCSRSLAADR